MASKVFSFRVPEGFQQTHVLIAVSLKQILASKDPIFSDIVALLGYEINAAKIPGIRKTLEDYNAACTPPIMASVLSYSAQKACIVVERDRELIAYLLKGFQCDIIGVAVPKAETAYFLTVV